MGMNMDWSIEVNTISRREAGALWNVLAYWINQPLDDCYYNGSFSTSFSTEGLNESDVIEKSLREYSLSYPKLTISAYMKQDTEECPDKWKFRNGSIRYYTGIVKYYEYDPKTGQTSNIPDGSKGSL